MLAVYKKELKTYFTSVIGYLFISFILVLIGIYFTSYNIGAAYPKFEVTLSAGTFVFLIAVPILTNRQIHTKRNLPEPLRRYRALPSGRCLRQ